MLLKIIYDKLRSLNIKSMKHDNRNALPSNKNDGTFLTDFEDVLENSSYPVSLYLRKPKFPMYKMTAGQEDNDLLNNGDYTFKAKVSITGLDTYDINVDNIDWDNSYLLLDYDGMTDYLLCLKTNNRTFSKHSDDKEPYIMRFKQLVLKVNDMFLSFDLGGIESSLVVDEEQGSDYIWKHYEIVL